jgi:hypothetical protein
MAARYRRSATRRQLTRRALVIALALVSLGGGGLAWTASHAAHSVQPNSGHPSDAPPVPGVSSPAGPASITGADLRSLAWTDFYGVELPVSKAAGPRDARGGLAWGFSDTPLGALLAAVNIGVRANGQWGPGIYGPTIREQVTGQAAAALLQACTADYEQGRDTAGVPDGQPLGRADVTEEAFRWVTYSPADATVDIVSAGPAGPGTTTARAVTRIEVEWLAGDWRVIAPPAGDWGSSAAPLASVTGYTRFPVPPA